MGAIIQPLELVRNDISRLVVHVRLGYSSSDAEDEEPSSSWIARWFG